MPMVSSTFAVISDLHCRLTSDTNDSYLTVGSLRTPSTRHPVQALLTLIEDEGLTADGLLVPGDLTNKARTEGLQQGWDYSLEIGRSLGARVVVPVIGNHDIDVFRLNQNLPVLHAVRNLKPEFPYKDQACVHSFFADGYCVLKVGTAEIIAVNTVVDHVDATTAKRGAFGVDRIHRMEASLHGVLKSPLRGA